LHRFIKEYSKQYMKLCKTLMTKFLSSIYKLLDDKNNMKNN